jgi:flagellar protein FlgJ
MIDKITHADPGMIRSAPKDDPAKVKEAAKQFEALLIGQMLKSMTDSEGGWMGTDGDDSAATAMQYAQETFAQSLAANGGLGLATLVAHGLEKTSASSAHPSDATNITPPR